MGGKLLEVEKELQSSLKKDFPEFKVGDTIRVSYKIQEKDKSRVHSVEGIVMKIQGALHRKSFTIRRVSYGESLEMTFPLYSPLIEKIEVVQPAKRRPRRARLYYLRGRVGKKATTV